MCYTNNVRKMCNILKLEWGFWVKVWRSSWQLKLHEDCSSLKSISIDFHVKNVMNYGMYLWNKIKKRSLLSSFVKNIYKLFVQIQRWRTNSWNKEETQNVELHFYLNSVLNQNTCNNWNTETTWRIYTCVCVSFVLACTGQPHKRTQKSQKRNNISHPAVT